MVFQKYIAWYNYYIQRKIERKKKNKKKKINDNNKNKNRFQNKEKKNETKLYSNVYYMWDYL